MTTTVQASPEPATGRPPSLRFSRDFFTRGAGWATRATGHPRTFLAALALVIVWAASGPYFRYSQNWQLVINTGTTIVTFLMVFLIQNAQNRESKAVHLKLDELIRCVRAARNEMIDIEHLTEQQLDLLAEQYSKIAQKHQHKLERCFEAGAEPQVTCATQEGGSACVG